MASSSGTGDESKSLFSFTPQDVHDALGRVHPFCAHEEIHSEWLQCKSDSFGIISFRQAKRSVDVFATIHNPESWAVSILIQKPDGLSEFDTQTSADVVLRVPFYVDDLREGKVRSFIASSYRYNGSRASVSSGSFVILDKLTGQPNNIHQVARVEEDIKGRCSYCAII